MFRTAQLRRLKATTAIAAIGFASGGLLLSPAAQAQVAEDEGVEVAQAAPPTTIIVTGSRIARPDLNTTSPVTIVSNEEFELQQAVNVEEVINDLPQVIPYATGASNNPGDGVASVDLRGLGPQRTLVLVNGRRYIYYNDDQIVDLNTIPAPLIERVDVVTGGASAVYGSDAIAGVTNFILKDDFEGFEFNAGVDLSEQGDGRRTNVDATIGANFEDGRGNVVFHASYFKRNPIFAGQRKATEVSFSDFGPGGGGLQPGGSSSIPSFRATVAGLAPLLGLGAATDAVRFDQQGNAITYSSSTDLYNFGPVNYLQIPQERILGYTRANYEINEHVRPYLEGVFINNRVDTELAATPIGNTTPFRGGSLGANLPIHVYSPFLGASTAAALQSLDTDGDGYVYPTAYGRRFLETGSRNQANDRNAYRIVAGVEGTITGSWEYDGYYQYSRTKNSQVQSGNIQLSALIAATQTAFMNPTTGQTSVTPIPGGQLVCASAAARANGCVPADIYGAGLVSPEAAEYLAIQAQNQELAQTQVATLAITNPELFDFGSGPVGIAFGVEHRREFAEYLPDTFLSSGDVGGFNAGLPTEGGYNVTEFFGEVVVPILSDVPFARRLEATGAARYSDYSNAVGGVFTWAAGGQWEPIYGLTIRGNYQKAIRGPSVNELFGGQTVSFDGAVDPCATPEAATDPLRSACIANGVPAAVVGTTAYLSGSTSFPALQGGNPDLLEERAKTWTVGAAFVPEFFDRLSLTVDYYNVSIDNLISTVGAQNIVNACLRFSASQYCNQIERSATGEFQSFVDLNINAASLDSDGIDVGARLALPFSGLISTDEGSLTFDFKGSYLLSLDYVPVVGLPIMNECAGRFGRVCSDTVAFGPTPHWRHAFRATYREGGAFISALWRYIGPSRDDDDSFEYSVERLKAANYFDLTMGIDVTENASVAFGVDNLFNKGFQPLASQQQGGNGQQSNTYPATYDVLGRYYSLSTRLRF